MSLEMTTNDAQPQPAKRRRVENEVPLYLPAEVVVPPFYEQERDAGAISTALLLGADAVCRLRSQAEQLRLQELLDKKESQLEQRVLELQAELSALSEKASEDVARRVAEQTLVVTQTLKLRSELRNDDVNLIQSGNEKLRDISASLEKQTTAIKRTTDDAVNTVRADERQHVADHVKRMTDVYQSEVEFLRGLETSLTANSKKQRQELDDLNKKLREAEDRALVARSKSTVQGAAGEVWLSELLKQAFGMALDFDLRDTSRTPNSGDLKAHIWGLDTMWDCKNYSRDVPISEVKKIKTDLEKNPKIDVAFLVALQTDIADHKDCVFDVELVSASQSLVYVNRLKANDNPVKLIQVFVRPLLSALRRAKQEYTERRQDSAEVLRPSVTPWIYKVKEQQAELNAEKKELEDEKRHFTTRYNERTEKIAKREEDLSQMLKAMNLHS